MFYSKQLNNIKCLSIFFIGFAVAVEKGAFLAVAAILALAACVMDKERFINLRDANFNKTMALFLMYIGILLAICLIQNDLHSSKMIARDFEKIVSFLIIYLLIGRAENFFAFGALGFACGLLYGESTVIRSLMQQKVLFSHPVGGMYGWKNALGSVLEIAIPFLVYAAYELRSNKKTAAFLSLVIIGAFISLAASGSRGAIMALFASAIFTITVYLYRMKYVRLKYIAVLGSMALLVCVILLYYSYNVHSYDSQRILIWTSSWHMFLDYPIFGVGYSNWADYYLNIYKSPIAKEILYHAHNLYFQSLSTVGLVGTTALFVFIGGLMKLAAQNSSKEHSAACAKITMADMFLAIMCGMLVHNAVDINFIKRFYLLDLFFVWGMCCLRFAEIRRRNQGEEVKRLELRSESAT